MTVVPEKSGGARKEFIAKVRRIVGDLDEGRGATACMLDIKAALHQLDRRVTKNITNEGNLRWKDQRNSIKGIVE